jgi:glycosyltransferase involved in cell wall biosynthesis
MVKALKQGGHDVKFISIHSYIQESYDVIKPTVLEYSRIFKLISKTCNYTKNKKILRGWPSVFKLWKEMKFFNPDVVIVRNFVPRSAIALLLGNLLGAGGILQEQLPKYRENTSFKKDYIKKIYKLLCNKPLVVVTPIKGNPEKYEDSDNRYYLPFTFDESLYESKKQNEEDVNKVSLITVGKFNMERKNHIGLLKSVASLREDHNIHLKLVGSLEDENDRNFQRIKSFISEKNMQDMVDISINMEYKNLQKEYSAHDLFVLPSFNEPAAVSPLEAMAAGLPVICSDTNGTKEYIIEGKTGYIFRSESQWDLDHKLDIAVSDQAKLKRMGECAATYVRQNHHPEQYCKRLVEIVKENFNNIQDSK